jgi:DUF1009 family protein
MNAHGQSSQSPLGIVSGSGSLPFAVADAVIARGGTVFLFGIEGAADTARIERYPHSWIAPVQLGRLIKELKQRNCRDIVFIGGLTRPPMHKVRVGLRTLLLLPRIIAAFRGGDDHLLKAMAKAFEEEGFRVHGAHEVAPEILMPAGALTSRRPSEAHDQDIVLGVDLLAAIAAFDVGQAAAVANGHVLAIEGPEGTDAMLSRVAQLRQQGRIHSTPGSGVLVKAPKVQQDRRFDLPAIGPRTVEAVRAAGLGGIAVIAGETVVADPEQVRAAAEAAGLFVVGLPARR